MFCKHCGTELPDTAISCLSCGARVGDSDAEAQQHPKTYAYPELTFDYDSKGGFGSIDMLGLTALGGLGSYVGELDRTEIFCYLNGGKGFSKQVMSGEYTSQRKEKPRGFLKGWSEPKTEYTTLYNVIELAKAFVPPEGTSYTWEIDEYKPWETKTYDHVQSRNLEAVAYRSRDARISFTVSDEFARAAQARVAARIAELRTHRDELYRIMAAQFGGEIDLSGSKDGLIEGGVYSGRIAIRGAGIQPTHSKLAEEKAWIWMSEKDKLIYFSNIGLHDLKNQYERFCFTHLLADVVARLLAEHGADVGAVSLKRNYLYLDDSGHYEDDHVVFIVPYQQQQDPLASW